MMEKVTFAQAILPIACGIGATAVLLLLFRLIDRAGRKIWGDGSEATDEDRRAY